MQSPTSMHVVQNPFLRQVKLVLHTTPVRMQDLLGFQTHHWARGSRLIFNNTFLPWEVWVVHLFTRYRDWGCWVCWLFDAIQLCEVNPSACCFICVGVRNRTQKGWPRFLPGVFYWRHAHGKPLAVQGNVCKKLQLRSGNLGPPLMSYLPLSFPTAAWVTDKPWSIMTWHDLCLVAFYGGQAPGFIAGCLIAWTPVYLWQLLPLPLVTKRILCGKSVTVLMPGVPLV